MKDEYSLSDLVDSADLESFDPLTDDVSVDAGAAAEETAHENEAGGTLKDGVYGMPDAEAAPAVKTVQVDDRPPEERIDALLTQMAPQRRTILAILRYCAQGRTPEDLTVYVAGLLENDHSIFTPETFCTHLERAGALQKMNADGTPYDPDQSPEPKTVVVDGVEYLEAAEPETFYWATTAAGASFVAADKPMERLHALFDQDRTYVPVYRKMLQMAAEEGGATNAQFAKEIDHDPLLEKPRYYNGHFLDRLERAEAVEWKGSWQITDTGAAALDELNACA